MKEKIKKIRAKFDGCNDELRNFETNQRDTDLDNTEFGKYLNKKHL